MNNALMGILRVRDLSSPPYLSTNPSVHMHQVDPEDRFVVIGSDGLFDFFTNEEVVTYVHKFLCANPMGDPAKYMIEQLLLRAAATAGIFLSLALLEVFKVCGPIVGTSNSTDNFGQWNRTGNCFIQSAIC